MLGHASERKGATRQAGRTLPFPPGAAVEDENGWVPIEDVALGEDGEVRIRLSRAAKGTAWLHMAYGADPLVRLRDSNRRPVVAFSVEVAGPSM